MTLAACLSLARYGAAPSRRNDPKASPIYSLIRR